MSVAALSSQLLLWFRRHAAVSSELRHTLPSWDGHALRVYVRLELQRIQNSKDMQGGVSAVVDERPQMDECLVFHERTWKPDMSGATIFIKRSGSTT
jgi:hypothetical protein